jgi:hypothetical protein
MLNYMAQYLVDFRSFLFKAGFLLVFFAISFIAKGQYYNIGQDPASIHWRQIKTEHFNFIYPSDFEQNAQNLANLFQYVYKYGTLTLENKPDRVPVIMHNRDVIPNAFTLWAPKRIELYTCPPQDTYSQKWLEQLAIHEYRHIVQMDMVNHGFTKGLNWIVGEQATAALTGFFIPMWFMEGDAVCAETALSHSGRGRIPSFEMEIRAQILEKGIFSYDKAVLGSYRDMVPDQYVLGYQLVASTRKKYGYKAWVTALDYVARKPYLIMPLNKGLKKATGIGKVELYRNIMREMDSAWKIQAALTRKSNLKVITKGNSSIYTKYKYPHYVNDSLIIAERSSLDDISRFVIIDTAGNEKMLCTPGFFSSDVFSVNIGTGFGKLQANKPGAFTIDNISISDGLMAWTEREADPRWQNRNYSVIKLFDFATGKIRTLSHKSRLFVPAISPDGTAILAVRVSENNTCSVVLIDPKSGSEFKCLMSSDEDFFLTPTWSDDGEKIVYMVLNEHGKSIRSFNIKSGMVTEILPPTFTDISNPKFVDKYILFNGAYSGIDNIYAVDTLSHNVFQVTSSAFGALDPEYSAARNTIVYSDYCSSGYRIAESGFDPSSWNPLSVVSDNSPSLYKYLSTEEIGMVDSTTITNTQFESKPYHKITHLFNFHSWAPVYFNYDKSETAAGISFMSQNPLSTATTTVGYNWDYAGKAGLYRLTYRYEGWYPVLDIDATYGKQAFYKSSPDHASDRYTWDETVLSGGVKLPLIFNHGKFFTGIQLKAHTTWQQIRNNTAPDSNRVEGTFQSADYEIYIYNYIKQASKDVYPHWGQVLDVNFRHSPFNKTGENRVGSIETTLFFPGITRHSGCKLYAGYQKKWDSHYPTNFVGFPRGTVAVVNDQLMSFRLNYKFPFYYPDASLGPVLYFKRVKANLFYDHAFLWDNERKDQSNSLGAEITTDLHFLRFLLPFDIGIREGYRPIQKGWFTDFLFLINLNI